MNLEIPYLRQTVNERIRRFAGVPHIDLYPDGAVLEHQTWPPDIHPFNGLMVDFVDQTPWMHMEYYEYLGMMKH